MWRLSRDNEDSYPYELFFIDKPTLNDVVQAAGESPEWKYLRDHILDNDDIQNCIDGIKVSSYWNRYTLEHIRPYNNKAR